METLPVLPRSPELIQAWERQVSLQLLLRGSGLRKLEGRGT